MRFLQPAIHLKVYPTSVTAQLSTIAIVGAGPAGFYSAHRLLKENQDVHIHMYERLPSPYGLVRFGVAPDHPDVKNVIHRFDEVAASPRFTFFGNVPIGDKMPQGVPLTDLQGQGYAATILAYGAAASDREFGIPGENDLGNVFSARAFVGWYNGLPEFANLPVDLRAGDTAFIFGQGNVALDVARLLLSPIDVLSKTDIALHALDALHESKIRHVHVIGRRGPCQVAFTAKELREMLSLPDTRFHIDGELLRTETQSNDSALSRNRPQKRLLGILGNALDPRMDATRSWTLDFLKSPVSFMASETSGQAPMVGSAILSRNTLVRSPSGNVMAQTGNDLAQKECALVVKSIGYRAASIDSSIPFDHDKSIVHHNAGKISDTLFVAGWLKCGPAGVIATTMRDAYQTVDTVLTTLARSQQQQTQVDAGQMRSWLLRNYGHDGIDWNGWQKISRHEKLNLGGHKMVKVIDMLRIAKA